ncbi:hypothetical protein KBC59_03260 [Patescibacteria group bacterium]|nr:hypothetical protein [Patescibacteria group bacterium]
MKKNRMVQGAIAALFALAVPTTALAQPASVQEQDYKIVSGPNPDSTYVEIGRAANVWTPSLAERFEVTMFDIRRENPTKTLAMCLKDGRSINFSTRGINSPEGRRSTTSWNGCEEKGGTRHVYVVPGETLEITGKKYMTPAEAAQAIDSVEKLRACADLDCMKTQLKALGAKIEIPTQVQTPVVQPPTAPQVVTPAPTAETPVEVAPVPAPAPVVVTDADRDSNRVVLGLIAILGFLSVFFLGMFLGRRGAKSTRRVDDRDAETKVTRAPVVGNIGDEQHARYKVIIGEREAVIKAQGVVVRRTLDDWGVPYKETDAFEILFGKLIKSVETYRKGKEDGDALRDKLCEGQATDDVTPLTLLHERFVLQAVEKASEKAAIDALANAPTVAPGESDEVKAMFTDVAETRKLLIPYIDKHKLTVPSDGKLSSLFSTLDEVLKKDESGLDGLRMVLATQAEQRGLTIEPTDNALHIATLLNNAFGARIRDVREQTAKESAAKAIAEFQQILRAPLEDDARALGIEFTDETLYEDLHGQVLVEFRRKSTKLGSMMEDVERLDELSRQIATSSDRLREIDSEVRLLGKHGDRSRLAQLHQGETDLLKGLSPAQDDFTRLMLAFTGVQVYSDSLLYTHRRAVIQELEHAQGMNGVLAELDNLENGHASNGLGGVPSSEEILGNPSSLRPPALPKGSIHDEKTVLVAVPDLTRNGVKPHLNGHKRSRTQPFGIRAVRDSDVPASSNGSSLEDSEFQVLSNDHPLLREMEDVVRVGKPIRIETPEALTSFGNLSSTFNGLRIVVQDSVIESIDAAHAEQPKVVKARHELSVGSLPRFIQLLGMPLPVRGPTQRPPNYEPPSQKF